MIKALLVVSAIITFIAGFAKPISLDVTLFLIGGLVAIIAGFMLIGQKLFGVYPMVIGIILVVTAFMKERIIKFSPCLLYTSPSPRD
mgnify:CR=1 FL=1